MKKQVLIVILILQMFQFYSFSAQNGKVSSEFSGRITESILRFTLNIDEMSPQRKAEVLSFADFVLRKLTHFTLYFLLGITMFALVSKYNIRGAQALLIAVAFCFVFACTDEFHQLFVGGRSGKFTDVIIDTLGALSSSAICAVVARRRKLRKEKSQGAL